ncbi:MAG: cysteine desulfurase [Lachnospiraceae bacterium]|nr:cysteine desulfurase [Lachnospiraceae bacterium]
MIQAGEIYLDNAATTRCDDEVLAAMDAAFRVDFGNPSSMHRKGYEAEQLMKNAQKTLAGTLGVSPAEILFTSGGTESDNLAILGCARANARRGRHLVTTAIEHAAVAKTMEALAEEGFEVTVLPVDDRGLVDPQAAAGAVREDTVLVSVMAVNNEIGAVQDLRAIGRAIRAKNRAVLFHTDAVQAYGKVPVDVRECGIDLLSVSGHKFHGPKGTGFLYVKKGTKIRPILFGGGQQNGLRSGTDNVPGAVGLAAAAQKAIDGQRQFAGRLIGLRDAFIREITEQMTDVRINGPAGCSAEEMHRGEQAAPHIVSLSVPGVRAEVLLHALEDAHIYVSAGSACSSHAAKKTPGTATLRAIGLPEDCLASTIRLSLSRDTTEEELRETAAALGEIVPRLRRYR